MHAFSSVWEREYRTLEVLDCEKRMKDRGPRNREKKKNNKQTKQIKFNWEGRDEEPCVPSCYMLIVLLKKKRTGAQAKYLFLVQY